MAYVDYSFYKDKYYGSAVPESDFLRLSERASDFLNVMTFDRLTCGLPADERSVERIKKAACALTEKFYEFSLAEKQALSAAMQSNKTQAGVSSGTVKSVSAGSESITYTSLSEMAGGAKQWSATYAAVGNQEAMNKLLYDAAVPYLMGIKTDEGVPILYAGL